MDTNALLAKFVFEKSVIETLKHVLKFSRSGCGNASGYPICQMPLVGVLLNLPLIAEVPSAAAHSEKAFCVCYTKNGRR